MYSSNSGSDSDSDSFCSVGSTNNMDELNCIEETKLPIISSLNGEDIIIKFNLGTSYIRSDESDGSIRLKKINNKIEFNPIIHNLTNSKIMSCTINGHKASKLKYISILNEIYNYIGDRKTISNNSIMNVFKGDLSDDKKFKYLEDLNMSVKFEGGNQKTMDEIISQVKGNDIDFNISILLQINDIVTLSN